MKSIAKYQVLEELGARATGKTYRVRDPFRKREFALKVLEANPPLPDPVKQKCCEHLASCAELSHRQIAKIIDLGEIDEGVFLATDWRSGTDLRLFMEDNRYLALDRKLALVAQVAEGLGYAHSRGIAHGNLKPANISVDSSMDAAILDFGTATWLTALLGAGCRPEGVVANYLAPEQILGQPFDARSDIFSLGLILYEFAAGRYPFSGEPGLIPREIVHSEPEPLTKLDPEIPRELEQLVVRALNKNPDQRLQTAEEFASGLYAAAQHYRHGIQPNVEAVPLAESRFPHESVHYPPAAPPPIPEVPPSVDMAPVQAEELNVAPPAFELALPSIPPPRERPQDAVPEPRPWTARSYAASTPLASPANTELPQPPPAPPLVAQPTAGPSYIGQPPQPPYVAAPPVEPEFQPPKSFLQQPISFEDLNPSAPKPKPKTKIGKGVFAVVLGLVLAIFILGSFISRQNLKASQSKNRPISQAAEAVVQRSAPVAKPQPPPPTSVAKSRAPKPGESGPDDLGNPEFSAKQTLNGPVRSYWESGRYSQALALVNQVLVNDPANEEALGWRKKIRAAQAAEAALK